MNRTHGRSLNGDNFASDITINGIEVGRGAGNVETNTAFGNTALDSNTTGTNNAAFGSNALTAVTTTNNSTAFGGDALSTSTGTGNTGIGYQAGGNVTTGANDTLIGNGASASTVSVSNEITLGNASVGTLRCAVTTISALSDARDKSNIVDLPLGLDFINALRPVRFTWACRDGTKVGVQEAGFIAQELDAVQQEFEAEDYLSLILKNNPDKLEAAPGKLLPILVKAIQELSAEFESYKASHP